MNEWMNELFILAQAETMYSVRWIKIRIEIRDTIIWGSSFKLLQSFHCSFKNFTTIQNRGKKQ